MMCAYCREPMNDGASVCKSCGRGQPNPVIRRRYKRVAVSLVIVAAVIGLGAMWLFDNIAKTDAIDGATARVRFVCAGKHIDKQAIAKAIIEEHDGGIAWSAAGDAVIMRLCPYN